jgi:WD40 repeat protein
MRMIPVLPHGIVKAGYISLLLFLVGNAQADGVPTDDLPIPTAISAPSSIPVLDHPMLVLTDGRVLAAGGMATSNKSVDHKMGADSEVWSPQTGQWQLLGNDLRFDPDQRVNLNQMADGRILLFATREGGNTPEYQARLWNPRSNTVEKPAVSARPKPDTDIAVLSDGRVLIVNGNEGSADTWDSRTNTVAHSEEPLLENSRWRALPLTNKQVLLVEMFPDDPAATRRNVVSSVALLWNPSSGEWKQIADLPVPFRGSGALAEKPDGSVQSTIGDETYQLAALDKSWERLFKPAPPAIAPKVETTINQTVAAPPQPISPPTRPAFAFDAAWISYADAVVNDLRLMIVLLPLLVLSILLRARANDLPYIIKPAIRLFQKSLAVVFLVFLAWIFLRNAPLQMFQEKVQRWRWLYEKEIATVGIVLIVLTPFAVRSIFRRLEKNGHTTFFKYGNLFARVTGVALILLLLISAIHDDRISQLQKYGSEIDYSWWIPSENLLRVLMAVFIPGVLYLLLRHLEKRKFPNISKYANKIFLAAVFGFIAFLVLWAEYAHIQNNLANNARYCKPPNTSGNIRQWTECVEAGNGALESLLFKNTKNLVLSLPSVPCRYVGTWSSKRTGSEYKVTLTDDSRYIAEPVHDNSASARTVSGLWGAHDDSMVWFEDQRSAWPIDVNTILPESRGRFSLIDVNGERTDFELIDAIKSNTCSL